MADVWPVVYLIISDLHMCGQPKDNRFDYDKEILVSIKHISSLISKYREQGCSVKLIFMGDIFDRSYRKPAKVGIDISLLDVLLLEADDSYVVIGNHEINFYANNPFWTMINSVDSERLSALSSKNIQPLGYLNRFTVCDRVEEADTVLHFNHFACVDSQPVLGKKNFAFYHKSIYAPEVSTYVKSHGITTDFNYVTSTSNISVLKKYDRCFMAHLHTLYGEWDMDGTIVEYLPSLGRPHKDEVSDSFLERNVPALIFSKNGFVAVEPNRFLLPKRDDSVIAEISTQEKERYEVQKVIKESKSYLSSTDDPIVSIRSYFSDNPSMLELIERSIEGDFSSIINSNVNRLLDIRNRRINRG